MSEPALTLDAGGISIALDADALRPVIEAVVADVLQRLGDDDRLAYSEAEAAKLLGVPRHVLRDCRLRGEISATKIGKSFMYSRRQLVAFVEGVPQN